MQDRNNISYNGLEIGSVSLKWVSGTKGEKPISNIYRHEGNPEKILREVLDAHDSNNGGPAVITGQPIRFRNDIHYRSEVECLERGLAYLQLKPDILVSLGGEIFTVYPMKEGRIRNIIAASKCAAGTGEFLVQQFQRMGYSLEQGIDAYHDGQPVDLATRCSVHCKSDATHKLNKGECSRADIARSLIDSLAEKVSKMIALSRWPMRTVVISGGLAANRAFLASLTHQLKESKIIVCEESPYLAAFGAYLFAQQASDFADSNPDRTDDDAASNETLAPLSTYEALVDFRVTEDERKTVCSGDRFLLAIDAGSTTTKAILLNAADGGLGASCYLRTLGNPITATRDCLKELIRQTAETRIRIIQAAVTGSAREMVSVYLDNCLSFNEILAHARAARNEVEEVDTLFEVGGQDSKFVSFLNGIPVDYAMNEGCSAGTGSFLEESVSLDMGIEYREISSTALKSIHPIRFGERCAAFINTDLRSALQKGAQREDVVAGLVFSIADNYVNRVVGPRALGETILFQGGVALNKAAALAMAAKTQKRIIVPRHPELMGCVGSAWLALDLIAQGNCVAKEYRLEELIKSTIELKGNFNCKSCTNHCEIQNIAVANNVYPFGGLCSKFENLRHGTSRKKDAVDYVEVRNRLMIEEYGPVQISSPKGRVGLPLALTAYALLPFYAKLINEMGYQVVLSDVSKIGNSKTMAPICYPCEIAHGAAYDLIGKNVDYIFLPYLIEFDVSRSYCHAFTCPSIVNFPDIIQAAFGDQNERFLTPHIALSDALLDTTRKQIIAMGHKLSVGRKDAENAFKSALRHYLSFRDRLQSIGRGVASQISSQPCVVLAGRPYITCSREANFSLPRKIVSRGYHALPADMLPWLQRNKYRRNCWHFSAQTMNAIEYVKEAPQLGICLLSCFSCMPDASMIHLVRKELAGTVFCYLEIDSHTAHAGIETRVGAFLDIIEENQKHVSFNRRLQRPSQKRSNPDRGGVYV